MKKRLLILGMITCIFGLTACGTEKEVETLFPEDAAIQIAESCVQEIIQISETGAVEQYKDYDIIVDAVESYQSASEDIGSYNGIVGSEATIDEESAVVNVEIEGTSHNAKVEVIIYEEGVDSITTNVIYSFGESMEKAALNTLLGMGTVFVVLILICFLISCFKIISVFENKGKDKEAAPKAAPKTAAPAPAAPTPVAAPKAEDLTNDLELVAVIAAAIAASEGRTTTDGLVVRSIRKANKNKWQKAL